MAPVQGQEPVSDDDFPGKVSGSTGNHITRDSNVCGGLLWPHLLASPSSFKAFDHGASTLIILSASSHFFHFTPPNASGALSFYHFKASHQGIKFWHVNLGRQARQTSQGLQSMHSQEQYSIIYACIGIIHAILQMMQYINQMMQYIDAIL